MSVHSDGKGYELYDFRDHVVSLQEPQHPKLKHDDDDNNLEEKKNDNDGDKMAALRFCRQRRKHTWKMYCPLSRKAMQRQSLNNHHQEYACIQGFRWSRYDIVFSFDGFRCDARVFAFHCYIRNKVM
jgi:hypothetical protein